MARSLHTPAHRELVSAVVAMRKKAGLTQRGLAQRLGREQNLVARIETGGRRLDLVELLQICAACGVDAVSEISRLAAQIAPLITASKNARVSRQTLRSANQK